jgi:trans-2,3-dihydro-3-hydroxyanthranilate isomerase
VADQIDRLAAFDPLGASAGGRHPASRRYVIVDVFTEVALQGNAVAVFTDGRGLRAETMQCLARELNLSETVFVLPAGQGGDCELRIFTPSTELPFAGHPVLGTAFVVGSALGRETVTLETGAGSVPVELVREAGQVRFGWMRQPVPRWQPFEREAQLLLALGVAGSELPVEAYSNGPLHVYVALESERAVASLRPDMVALAQLGELGVSCFAASGTGWKTRMFAPALGVTEDPATGSAAGPLAVHLARHRQIAFGETIEISQGAEIGRPSTLRARTAGDGDRIERVEVGGAAVILGGGTFSVPPE